MSDSPFVAIVDVMPGAVLGTVDDIKVGDYLYSPTGTLQEVTSARVLKDGTFSHTVRHFSGRQYWYPWELESTAGQVTYRPGVRVLIEGTGGGGYSRTINVPQPTTDDLNAPVDDFSGPLTEWWEDYVFPATGSGDGGRDYVEAKIADAPHATDLVGRSTTWEG
jgi:hypothetical protein